jgi:hypothetical protein
MLQTYTRIHVPSGRKYLGEFNPSHNEVFAQPDWYPQRTLDVVMKACTNKWNASLPAEWHYTLNPI